MARPARALTRHGAVSCSNVRMALDQSHSLATPSVRAPCTTACKSWPTIPTRQAVWWRMVCARLIAAWRLLLTVSAAPLRCLPPRGAAILLGAPVPVNAAEWAAARGVVAGRLVNGYCRTDWVLGYLYRAHGMSSSVAGIQAVGVAGVEDVELTTLVGGHAKYGRRLREILQEVNFHG